MEKQVMADLTAGPEILRELMRRGGVDTAVIVDQAGNALRRLIREVSVDVVVGNLGTYEGAVDVITTVEKVDGFRVGIASGSIRSTGVVTGVVSGLWLGSRMRP